MSVLEIRQYPDPVLKGKCQPVKDITPEILKLIEDMAETMYAAPGVGLAAPQVGVPIRLAVIDVSLREENQALLVLINPEIISAEGEAEEEEGCLSVKDFNAVVKRYETVRVRVTGKDGKVYEMDGEGLLARAFQHELDHLDGVLFIDRISALKRNIFKRRLRKLLKMDEEN
ncbi:MAG TPA: peptide deformylase [Nitrospirota bacterium]